MAEDTRYMHLYPLTNLPYNSLDTLGAVRSISTNQPAEQR
jgi:hypothetical protein